VKEVEARALQKGIKESTYL